MKHTQLSLQLDLLKDSYLTKKEIIDEIESLKMRMMNIKTSLSSTVFCYSESMDKILSLFEKSILKTNSVLKRIDIDTVMERPELLSKMKQKVCKIESVFESVKSKHGL